MRRLFTIVLLLCSAAVGACSLPETTRPELDKDAPFPNLADVPSRPATMAPAEREQILRDLQRGNAAGNSQ